MNEDEFIALAHALDERVQALEAHPSEETRELGFALLQAVDALHRAGLACLVRRIQAQDAAGWARILEAEPAVRMLVELYDLLPESPRFQAEQVLAEVRASIRAHGGDLEIVEVNAGVVGVRLAGACLDCPALCGTLRQGIEAALRSGLPGFKELQVT